MNQAYVVVQHPPVASLQSGRVLSRVGALDVFSESSVPPTNNVIVRTSPLASDDPVAIERDAFGHRDYVVALASIVNEAPPPATIGLFGPWGIGKSTILAGLREELTGAAYAYFDAWKFEEDSLRRAFLREVTSQLEGAELSGFKVDPDLREMHVDEQRIEQRFSFDWRSLVRASTIALVIGGLVFVGIQISYLADFFSDSTIGKRLAPAAGAALVALVASLFSQVITVTGPSIVKKSLNEPDRFAEKFSEMLGHLKKPKLIVAVDNLDRCNPDRAAEVLSTIKTFLEPIARDATAPWYARWRKQAPGKSVVFVVAVDDAALKRHLRAREGSKGDGMSKAAMDSYLEDYLAKFFGVRFPIRELVADDLRSYVETHVAPLAAAHLGGQDSAPLISLVASGLRNNPRRVKQFANDLEVRLRLLQARETSIDDKPPRIAVPMSKDVLGVAKIAIIEAEWPRAFDRIRESPQQLAHWHSEAETASEVWPGYLPEQLHGADEDRANARSFASFLRASSGIATPNLRVLLDLKQSPNEVGIPGFAEFREAVIGGDREAVARLLSDATPETAVAIASRMPTIVEEEIGHGYYDAARAAVDAVVSIDSLASDESLVGETIRRAMKDPAMRRELGRVDPHALLSGANGLQTKERSAVIDVFVDRVLDVDLAEPVRANAALAVSQHLEDLSDSTRELLRSGLSNTETSMAIYGPIAGEDFEMLPGYGVQAGLAALQRGIAQRSQPLLEQEALYVLRAALATSDDDGASAAVFNAARDGFAADHPESWESIARLLYDLLSYAGNAGEDALVGAMEAAAVRIGVVPRSVRDAILGFIDQGLSHLSSERRDAICKSATNQYFNDPGRALSELITGVELRSAELADRFADRVVQLGLDHPSHRTQAVSALTYLPVSASDRIARLFTGLVDRNELLSAVELLDLDPIRDIDVRKSICESVLAKSEQNVQAGVPISVELLSELRSLYDRGQADRLSDLVDRMHRQGIASVADLVTQLSAEPRFGEIRTIALRLAGLIEEADHSVQTQALAGASVLQLLDDLPATERSTVIERLGQSMVESSELRMTRAIQLASSSRLADSEAANVVKWLLRSADKDSDRAHRVELLAHAMTVAREGADGSAAEIKAWIAKSGDEALETDAKSLLGSDG